MKSGEAEVHLGCICGCQTGMDIKWGSLHHLFLLGTSPLTIVYSSRRGGKELGSVVNTHPYIGWLGHGGAQPCRPVAVSSALHAKYWEGHAEGTHTYQHQNSAPIICMILLWGFRLMLMETSSIGEWPLAIVSSVCWVCLGLDDN